MIDQKWTIGKVTLRNTHLPSSINQRRAVSGQLTFETIGSRVFSPRDDKRKYLFILQITTSRASIHYSHTNLDDLSSLEQIFPWFNFFRLFSAIWATYINNKEQLKTPLMSLKNSQLLVCCTVMILLRFRQTNCYNKGHVLEDVLRTWLSFISHYEPL